MPSLGPWAACPSATAGPVEVFLPALSVRARARDREHQPRVVTVPDPRAGSGMTEVAIIDVDANGYRLRLIDHPAAFDRDGMYGPPGGGDFPDNAWRYGLFCRAALETLRTEPERPVDILHLHDWHSGPAAIQRDAWLADDPVLGRAAIVITLHNLAYHGWTPREQLDQLGLAPGGGVLPADADGIDLIREGIVRAEVANTVSPGFRPGGTDAGGSASGWRTRSPPRATDSSGSSTGSTPPSGIRRPTRRSPRPYSADDLSGKRGLPGGPARAGWLRPGR